MKKVCLTLAVLFVSALTAQAALVQIDCANMAADLTTENYNAQAPGEPPIDTSIAAGFPETTLVGTALSSTDTLNSGADGNALCSSASLPSGLEIVAVGGGIDGLAINSGFRFSHTGVDGSFQFQFRNVDQANRQTIVQTLCGGSVQDSIQLSSGPSFPLPILCFESDLPVEAWQVLDAVGSTAAWCIDDVGSAGRDPNTCIVPPTELELIEMKLDQLILGGGGGGGS